MSSIATLNGVQYIIPAYNDTGWAQGTGNLSQYLVAIAANTLQPSGGAFTLTADVDFGANFGVKALFLKTETANPASAGVIRLASADTIKWRNNANGADIALSKDSSDNLQYNATKVLLSGAVVNADINAAAAIAVSKLAALTVSRAVATDGSGFLTVATTTAAELAFVSGVTSAIQTQLNNKLSLTGGTMSGAIAMGSTKITGLAAGSASGDALSYSQSAPKFGPTAATDTTVFLDAPTGQNSYLDLRVNNSASTNWQLIHNSDDHFSIWRGSDRLSISTAGAVSIQGTATNDDAAAGKVGEFVSSFWSVFSSPATTTFGDATSISLTAGDWDIEVHAEMGINEVANVTRHILGLSTTSGNSSATLTQGYNRLDAIVPGANSNMALSIPRVRATISATTTYYVKVSSTYTGTARNARAAFQLGGCANAIYVQRSDGAYVVSKV
jgi:hypothetical protein